MMCGEISFIICRSAPTQALLGLRNVASFKDEKVVDKHIEHASCPLKTYVATLTLSLVSSRCLGDLIPILF